MLSSRLEVVKTWLDKERGCQDLEQPGWIKDLLKFLPTLITLRFNIYTQKALRLPHTMLLQVSHLLKSLRLRQVRNISYLHRLQIKKINDISLLIKYGITHCAKPVPSTYFCFVFLLEGGRELRVKIGKICSWHGAILFLWGVLFVWYVLFFKLTFTQDDVLILGTKPGYV